MNVKETNIRDVLIIEPKVFSDSRGFFMETFLSKTYSEILGIEEEFVQDIFSYSNYSVLRGLHFQKTLPQGKLIQVIEGEVFDVVVDIRKDSDSFGKWLGLNLGEKNHLQLWVPPGLAHGFMVISKKAKLQYKLTNYYLPGDEYTLAWDDPEINIKWPLKNPILSDKDSRGLLLRDILKL